MFILHGIRQGRRGKQDYFVTIHQLDGFSATISKQRGESISIHYQDAGYLTFDAAHVDSFDSLKIKELQKIDILQTPITVKDFSGEIPPRLQNEVKDGVISFGGFLRGCLELNIEDTKPTPHYQWFINLLDSPKGQDFLQQHMATIRYFHGDFDPLKDFLLTDDTEDAEEESIFEDPSESDGSFFEEDDGIDFET